MYCRDSGVIMLTSIGPSFKSLDIPLSSQLVAILKMDQRQMTYKLTTQGRGPVHVRRGLGAKSMDPSVNALALFLSDYVFLRICFSFA